MAKQKKATGKEKKPTPGQTLAETKNQWWWVTDSRFLVPVILYLVMLYVWRANIFDGMILNVSPDRITGVSLRRITAQALADGIFPFWNPYFFGGMAMFESFQSSWLFYPLVWLGEGFIADPANPGFYNGGLAWLLFFGSPVDFLLIHYLIGAVGMAFLMRHFGANTYVQLFVGLLFLLSPQLVVLADVGHGSKLYAMCWLPWLLLALDRAFDKITPSRIALLGVFFAITMSTQHIQVAYYGYMMAGTWWLARQFHNLKLKQLSRSLKELGVFAVGGILGLLGTSVIYLNTLAFAGDSTRGGGGVGWDYATNWSYHPLESISMFIPDFFGFGGRTYWGYLPFTDMPLYWGIPAVVLAIVGLFFVNNWKVRGLFAIGILAWITSFGKFFPILYKLFYDVLPYFNKFRVPMMIHILVLMSALIIAGFGLQRIFQVFQENENSRKLWAKFFSWATITSLVLLIIVYLTEKGLASGIASWVVAMKPGAQQAAPQFGEVAAGSITRSLLFAFITLATITIAFYARFPAIVLGSVIALLVLFDLEPFTGRLLHPQPEMNLNVYFQEDDLVKKLKSENSVSRLLPLDATRPVVTWAAFGIELQTGFSGSKPATFGYLEEKNAITNPNILYTMLVKYLYSSKQLEGIPVIASGRMGYIHQLPNNLEKAYLRGNWKIIEDKYDAIDHILSDKFKPAQDLILERKPDIPRAKEELKGQVLVTKYNLNEIDLNIETSEAAMLVYADNYTSSGWNATVNGKNVDIIRANGMFKSIAIPQGSSVVRMWYKPAYWTLSVLLTTFAWIVMIGLLIWGLLIHKKKKGNADKTLEANV
ncbi:YfhO family protein [bacterium]|nr:YfhO family protein [bacterium]